MANTEHKCRAEVRCIKKEKIEKNIIEKPPTKMADRNARKRNIEI